MKRLLLLLALQSTALVAMAEEPAKHLFYENFAAEENFTNNWVVLDNNNDKSTWLNDRDSEPDADGGIGIARYQYNSKNAADDYLTTKNPVTLKAGANCISFYYRTSSSTNYPERFEVLYGKSSDVSTMTVIASLIDKKSKEWVASINDFEVAEAGDYYFSFHAISEKNKGSIYIDNIAIDEGSFNGVPDIALENLILPPSDCTLGSSPIKATVKNLGTGPINGFSLYYELEDEDIKVTQEFTDVIAADASLDVTFTTPVDFSSVDQGYNIKVVAQCAGQTNFANDTVAGRVINLSPALLPFESNFEKAIDLLNWNPITPNGWIYKSGAYKAEVPSSLLSRCIHMEPGNYRLSFNYSAGSELLIGGIKYDLFNITFGKSGSDMATWSDLGKFKEFTNYETRKKDIKFTVTEEGNYGISFNATELSYLEIFSISVSKILEHDIKVESITSKEKYPRMIPKSHLKNTAQEFEVVVANYGQQIENNIKLDVKAYNDVLSTTTIPTLAVGETKKETFAFNLADIASSKELIAAFSAEASIAQDDDLENNTAQLETIVTDSIYAWDNPTDFTFGIGGKGPVAFGTAFTIMKEDVLTSLSLYFIAKEGQDNDQITLSVYEINTDNNSEVKSTMVTKSVLRGKGGEEIVYKLPETKLVPGKYMFEVKQEGTVNMGLLCDQSKEGLIAVTKAGFMNELPGYGAPYIRPNFSKSASTGIQGNASIKSELLLYPNPASERINIKTNGSQIKNITIHNLLGQAVLTATGNGTAEQDMNISALSSGTYLVVIATDANTETVKLIVK
ncbi:MAG: choice-of-anchor J domain-containing protein [Bacteroides nordii]